MFDARTSDIFILQSYPHIYFFSLDSKYVGAIITNESHVEK